MGYNDYGPNEARGAFESGVNKRAKAAEEVAKNIPLSSLTVFDLIEVINACNASSRDVFSVLLRKAELIEKLAAKVNQD
ncbi:hypothetical protein HYS79_00965 [Patescibacteria group bacterium]|nr:hypothetical protein [Patescibacteria group bacterium]